MKIITLTLNPAFDLHCHIENFAPYHENLAKITDYSASGKGVNISLALTVCGVPNTAFVVLGEENGEAFEIHKYAATLSNIQVDGVHCHVGSQIFDVDPFGEAARVMMNFIRH